MNFTLIFFLIAQFSFITRDNLNNTYAINENASVEKIDSTGKTIFTYSDSKNGTPLIVDAFNPLNVMIFYRDFNHIAILNNTLSPIQTIDLNAYHYLAAMACVSNDNLLWIFDKNDHKLKKINRQGVMQQESIDLLNQFGYELNPVFMLASGNYVFFSDTLQGIYVFDLYGAEVMNIPMQDVSFFQVQNDLLIYQAGLEVHQYNIKTFKDEVSYLPMDFPPVQIILSTNKLAALTKNQLLLYKISE